MFFKFMEKNNILVWKKDIWKMNFKELLLHITNYINFAKTQN